MKRGVAPETEPKPFLTVPEAAEILGLSTQQAYRLARQKRFPVAELSARRYVVPKDALAQWVAAKNAQALEVVKS